MRLPVFIACTACLLLASCGREQIQISEIPSDSSGAMAPAVATSISVPADSGALEVEPVSDSDASKYPVVDYDRLAGWVAAQTGVITGVEVTHFPVASGAAFSGSVVFKADYEGEDYFDWYDDDGVLKNAPPRHDVLFSLEPSWKGDRRYYPGSLPVHFFRGKYSVIECPLMSDVTSLEVQTWKDKKSGHAYRSFIDTMIGVEISYKTDPRLYAMVVDLVDGSWGCYNIARGEYSGPLFTKGGRRVADPVLSRFSYPSFLSEDGAYVGDGRDAALAAALKTRPGVRMDGYISYLSGSELVGYGYAVKDGKVSFNGRILDGVDVRTFHVFPGNFGRYAADRSTYWIGGRPIGVTPAESVFISPRGWVSSSGSIATDFVVGASGGYFPSRSDVTGWDSTFIPHLACDNRDYAIDLDTFRAIPGVSDGTPFFVDKDAVWALVKDVNFDDIKARLPSEYLLLHTDLKPGSVMSYSGSSITIDGRTYQADDPSPDSAQRAFCQGS